MWKAHFGVSITRLSLLIIRVRRQEWRVEEVGVWETQQREETTKETINDEKSDDCVCEWNESESECENRRRSRIGIGGDGCDCESEESDVWSENDVWNGMRTLCVWRSHV